MADSVEVGDARGSEPTSPAVAPSTPPRPQFGGDLFCRNAAELSCHRSGVLLVRHPLVLQ